MIILQDGDLIAISRGVTKENIVYIAEILIECGMRYLEVSLSEENEGLGCIEYLAGIYSKELHIGAGTVLRQDLVDRALNAGATYLITPAFDKELITYMLKKNARVFPGVFTPSDIMQSINMGLTQLKLFPIVNIADNYIKNIKSPFPNVEFIGVGGINIDNIRKYYKEGCHFFGLGSDLIPKGADKTTKTKIANKAKAYIQAINELRIPCT